MALSASKLRENIYRILDQVLETGVPVEIERGGRKLRIVAVDEPRKEKLASLEPHPDFLRCDPDELVHIDWSDSWRP
jgi:hypothetical protein